METAYLAHFVIFDQILVQQDFTATSALAPNTLRDIAVF
jgi:hypothetical protein